MVSKLKPKLPAGCGLMARTAWHLSLIDLTLVDSILNMGKTLIEVLRLVYMDHDTMRKLQGQLACSTGENCRAHEDATMTSLEKVQVESRI